VIGMAVEASPFPSFESVWVPIEPEPETQKIYEELDEAIAWAKNLIHRIDV